jgi:ElaB/YqjD/DUF883 family membrane-anchored ribosome-binding protein
MENDFSSTDSMSGQSGAGSTNSAGTNATNAGTGAGAGAGAGTTNTGSTNAGTTGARNAAGDQGLTDRARDLAGSAQGKLADIGSSVRDRAGQMKDSLADALESGADRLRQRGASSDQGTLAGATSAGTVSTGDGRVAQVTDRVATGMDKTADWLRDADLEGLRTSIETQVKEHPGRTLLIAAGLGYLLGKALRK